MVGLNVESSNDCPLFSNCIESEQRFQKSKKIFTFREKLSKKHSFSLIQLNCIETLTNNCGEKCEILLKRSEIDLNDLN